MLKETTVKKTCVEQQTANKHRKFCIQAFTNCHTALSTKSSNRNSSTIHTKHTQLQYHKSDNLFTKEGGSGQARRIDNYTFTEFIPELKSASKNRNSSIKLPPTTTKVETEEQG